MVLRIIRWASIGELSPCRLHEFPHSGQRNDRRIVVHAKPRRCAISVDDVGFGYARTSHQRFEQPLDATIGCVVDVGKNERQV
jgi:hypothetical protein